MAAATKMPKIQGILGKSVTIIGRTNGNHELLNGDHHTTNIGGRSFSNIQRANDTGDTDSQTGNPAAKQKGSHTVTCCLEDTADQKDETTEQNRRFTAKAVSHPRDKGGTHQAANEKSKSGQGRHQFLVRSVDQGSVRGILFDAELQFKARHAQDLTVIEQVE